MMLRIGALAVTVNCRVAKRTQPGSIHLLVRKFEQHLTSVFEISGWYVLRRKAKADFLFIEYCIFA
jgi:hypothetical protein